MADIVDQAMHTLRRLTIALRPIEGPDHAVYDAATHTIYVDPHCPDIAAAVLDVLHAVMPAERSLGVITGDATACGLIPEQGAPTLRVVRDE